MVYSNSSASKTTAGISNTKMWRAWNAQYTGTMAGCCTYSVTSNTYGGWPFWTSNATTSGTTNTIVEYVWQEWNETYEVINSARAEAQQIRRYARRQMTDEEVRVELQRAEVARAKAEAEAQRARDAQARAESLLQTFLSPEQRDDLEKKKCFYVEIPSRDGKVERYRIDRGSHGNVKQVDARGSIIRSFCIQPTGVPVGDSMLAQKLFLESSDETRDEFWKTANITPLVHEKAIPAHIPREQRRRYAAEHGLLH